MTSDRQAIIEHHRKARLDSTTGNAGTLADVERAALAYRQKVAEHRRQLESENRFTPEAIEQEIEQLALGWYAEKESLEKIVAEIEERQSFKATPDLPERSDTMREDSARFERYDRDKRSEALVRAMRGDDDRLALALATLPPDVFAELVPFDGDRRKLVERAAPGTTDNAAKQSEIAKRIAGARATLAEVSQSLGARK